MVQENRKERRMDDNPRRMTGWEIYDILESLRSIASSLGFIVTELTELRKLLTLPEEPKPKGMDLSKIGPTGEAAAEVYEAARQKSGERWLGHMMDRD